jgi:hypothetical protein
VPTMHTAFALARPVLPPTTKRHGGPALLLSLTANMSLHSAKDSQILSMQRESFALAAIFSRKIHLLFSQ